MSGLVQVYVDSEAVDDLTVVYHLKDTAFFRRGTAPFVAVTNSSRLTRSLPSRRRSTASYRVSRPWRADGPRANPTIKLRTRPSSDVIVRYFADPTMGAVENSEIDVAWRFGHVEASRLAG